MLLQISEINIQKIFFSSSSIQYSDKPNGFDNVSKNIWLPKPNTEIFKFEPNIGDRKISPKTYFTLAILSLKNKLHDSFTTKNKNLKPIHSVLVSGGYSGSEDLRLDFKFGDVFVNQYAIFKYRILTSVPPTTRTGFLTRKTAIIPLPMPKDI